MLGMFSFDSCGDMSGNVSLTNGEHGVFQMELSTLPDARRIVASSSGCATQQPLCYGNMRQSWISAPSLAKSTEAQSAYVALDLYRYVVDNLLCWYSSLLHQNVSARHDCPLACKEL